nr:hypothetical protein [Angustibacter aerolatus]
MLGIDEAGLGAARGFGAHAALAPDDAPADTYDVVLDCTGAASLGPTLTRIAAIGGRIMEVGIPGRPVDGVDLAAFVTKGLTLQGVLGGVHLLPRALQAHRVGGHPPRPAARRGGAGVARRRGVRAVQRAGPRPPEDRARHGHAAVVSDLSHRTEERRMSTPDLLATCWTTAGDAVPLPGRDDSPVPLPERIAAAGRAGFTGFGVVHNDLAIYLRDGDLPTLAATLRDNGMRHVEPGVPHRLVAARRHPGAGRVGRGARPAAARHRRAAPAPRQGRPRHPRRAVRPRDVRPRVDPDQPGVRRRRHGDRAGVHGVLQHPDRGARRRARARLGPPGRRSDDGHVAHLARWRRAGRADRRRAARA